MENEFRKHHWRFFRDEYGDCINVYEERDGDVIGGIYDYDLDKLKETIKDFSESELYDFICNVIEWY